MRLDAHTPTLPPWPPFADFPAPEPPPPPLPREPAWSGLELTIVVLFTRAAMIAATLVAAMAWALLTRAAGLTAGGFPERALVFVSLAGQTGGFLAGVAFAWLWLSQTRSVKFWAAVRWRSISGSTLAAALAGGAALMIVVQGLGQVLPMPSQAPMDKLFTPQTAWMLVIYGVAIAPFFEEFFFRGLLYPTLRATFAEGMNAEELRSWRPLVRALSGLGILTLLLWVARTRFLFPGSRPGVGMVLALVGLVVALAMPQWPIAGVGWVLNRMAGWGQAEGLAIFITGLLFGLMHAAQLGWAWAAVLILVLVGIVLTVVRARTGSLMPSWLVHVAYNGTLFAVQYVATQGFRHFPQGLH